MPSYDYKCKSCSNVWVAVHSIHDTDPQPCPECGLTDTYKYFGAMKTVPVHFKGSGWHIVDSALDAAGMPKNIQQSKETRDALRKM